MEITHRKKSPILIKDLIVPAVKNLRWNQLLTSGSYLPATLRWRHHIRSLWRRRLHTF